MNKKFMVIIPKKIEKLEYGFSTYSSVDILEYTTSEEKEVYRIFPNALLVKDLSRDIHLMNE